LKLIRFLMILVIASSITSGFVKSVSADQGFDLENVSYEYEFGKTLSITATVPQIENIKSISVSIQPENLQPRQINGEIGNDSQVNATFDLQTNSISPFSRVFFWFTAELQNGTMISSPSYWFDYVDNRFPWKSNSSKLFTVYWVFEDSQYGQRIQQIAKSGLERSTQLLPVAPNIPIEIYIYPDITSMKSIFPVDSELWVNGKAILKANRIIVVDQPPLDDFTDLERLIPHETMHLLQFHVLVSNYAYAPTWLMEGLASQAELYPDADKERVLSKATETGRLTPLSTLCLGISQDPEQANIDYAQSASLVRYVKNTYGNQSLLTMLQAASSGKDCSSLVNSTLGISLQRLEDDWLASVSSNAPVTTIGQVSTFLWIFIPGVLVVSGLILLAVRRSRTKSKETKSE